LEKFKRKLAIVVRIASVFRKELQRSFVWFHPITFRSTAGTTSQKEPSSHNNFDEWK